MSNLDLDKVCYMVNKHPSELPIFFSRPRGQKAKLTAAKAKCPYSRDYLYKLYVTQGKTRKQLCAELNVTMGIINRWFTALEIKLPADAYGEGMARGRQLKLDPNSNSRKRKCQSMARENKVNLNGYTHIFNPSHPKVTSNGYVAEHRQVIERQIKRFLEESEDVHHLNYNRSDNRPENLMMLKNVDHGKIHHFMEQCGAFALGLTSEMPEPLKLSSPAFWNGQWYETISDLELSNTNNFSKGKIN